MKVTKGIKDKDTRKLLEKIHKDSKKSIKGLRESIQALVEIVYWRIESSYLLYLETHIINDMFKEEKYTYSISVKDKEKLTGFFEILFIAICEFYKGQGEGEKMFRKRNEDTSEYLMRLLKDSPNELEGIITSVGKINKNHLN